EFRVGTIDHVALPAQLGCKLTALDRELVLQQSHLLRKLVPGKLGQLAKHLLLHLLLYFRQSDKLLVIAVRELLELRPLLKLLEVRHYQQHWEAASVADHHGLRYKLVCLRLVLDRLRGDVLATGDNYYVLLAIGDSQVIVLQLADVAGVEPSVRIDNLGGLFRLPEVPLHDVGASREDLAVLGDAHLHSFKGAPNGAQPEVSGSVHRDHGRGLRQAVAFQDHQSGSVEELVDLGGEWGTPGHEVLHAPASAFLELGKDQLLRDAVLDAQKAAWRAPRKALISPAVRNACCP